MLSETENMALRLLIQGVYFAGCNSSDDCPDTLVDGLSHESDAPIAQRVLRTARMQAGGNTDMMTVVSLNKRRVYIGTVNVIAIIFSGSS